MSASHKHHGAARPGSPGQSAPDNSAPDGRPASEPAGQVPPVEAAAEPTELEKLRQEVAELREKNLRLIAESRNAHQRTQREKAEAIKFAEADFARDLLVVLDDLVRTQQSAEGKDLVQPASAPEPPPAASELSAEPRLRALLDGVRIVHEHFLKVLKAHAISPIEALGRKFDPHEHEALFQLATDQYAAGTVAQELARGYKMHDRVLRPTRVAVSKGPAEPSPAAAPTPGEVPESASLDEVSEE